MVAYVYAATSYSVTGTRLIDEAGTNDVTMWENVATKGICQVNRVVNAGFDPRSANETYLANIFDASRNVVEVERGPNSGPGDPSQLDRNYARVKEIVFSVATELAGDLL